MSDIDPGKVDVGERSEDAARSDMDHVLADLRDSVQEHRVKAEAARVRAETVATELVATRAGRGRVIGDERFQERIAQLVRDVDAVSHELIAGADDEARARRAAADLDADRTLGAARDEARTLLDQAHDAADQVLSEGGAQVASLDSERARLENERENVLKALTSLHDRLGDVASTIGEQA